MGWQPIGTAPKDGTNVLAYEDGAVTVLYWDEDRDSWFYPYKGGKTRWPDITHWMPLPPPPTDTDKGSAGNG